MKLSLADKLALIYTSAGSMRKVASLSGLSHQQVSRILHNAAQGRSNANYEARYEVAEGVQVAFDIHRDLARGVARRHQIPFDGAYPIYVERLPLKHKGVFVDGVMVFKGSPEYCRDFIEENDLQGQARIRSLLGDRIGGNHLHWISDKLRDSWVKATSKTGAYYSVSFASVVNLRKYNQQANERAAENARGGLPRTAKAIKGREEIKSMLNDGIERASIYTPYTSMSADHSPDMIVQSLNEKLETRHAPATGERGTAYATSVLLQLDTRKNKNASKTKARGNTRRNR